MRRITVILAVGLSWLMAAQVHAAKPTKTIGNANAPVGGTFYENLDAEPSTLNPLKGNDAYTNMVTNYAFDSLLSHNIETYEFEPALAEKWDVAKDGKSITFKIRQGVKFHDGTPVTIEDVKFSFDVNFDPKLADAVHIPYYENIEKAEILSPTEIKFYIKKKYFQNLSVLGTDMAILPKATYGDASKKMNKTMVGSGPYMLEKYDQGKAIILKRNPDWWGYNLPEYRGYNKFERLNFKIIKDENAKLETFKKGDLDFLALTPEQYEKKTDGPEWGTKVFKKAVENSAPKNTGFIGFNLRRPLFKDREVRVALSQLMNREMMIQKFLYGKALPATGPWYQQSPDADPKAKADKFDPAAARAALAKAGWKDSNKDGILDKVIDGKPTDFRFTITIPTDIWEKYLTVYKEEAKKAGIDVNIKLIEWNAFQKALDDNDFDTVAMAWGGVVENDPKQIWHSASAVKGGSNFVGYSNPEVDKMIDVAREELDSSKRRKLLQKVFSAVAYDHPDMFLWNLKYIFYAHAAKIQQAQPTYRYDLGKATWWLKE